MVFDTIFRSFLGSNLPRFGFKNQITNKCRADVAR